MTSMRQFLNLTEKILNPDIKKFAKDFHFDGDPSKAKDARDKPDWVLTLNEIMEKYGFKQLGSGISASVYGKDGVNYVVKIFKTDGGYENWLDFCLHNQKNKYVPKIIGDLKRLNDVFSAVKLERLAYGDFRGAHGAQWVRDSIKRRESYDKDLQTIIDFIYDNDYQHDLDLTNTNFMERGTQTVIIDPFNWDE